MIKTIITTVGTSIFTNYFDEEKNRNIDRSKKEHYRRLKDRRYSEWEEWQVRIDNLKPVISSWIRENKNTSAEIKSILKLKGSYNDIKVHFIATDTILSVLASDILKAYTLEIDIDCEFKRETGKDIIKGLQISNAEDFRKVGIVNLVDRVNTIINGDYNNVILNITGGYKAIIPYMTIMGQLNNIPIYYIFEDTDELIEIPQAPIDLDFSIIDENYCAFRSLKKDRPPNSRKFTEDFTKEVFERLKTNLVEVTNDEKVILTPIGTMLVDRYEELFNSGKYNRQNLLSNIIELKLFKYFIKKYMNKAYVEHGKKLGEEGYDIDMYIENKDMIKAIEVKSGGNVPIWKDKAGEKSIEYKLTEGGFKYLIKSIDNYNGKNLNLEVFLYHPKCIHQSVVKQMDELCKKFPQEAKFLKCFWLKIPDNYSTNTHWDITDEKIKELKTENQKGGIKDV